MFLVEVIIIVMAVIKPRLDSLPSREVLLLRRWGYNRVIASTVEKERGGWGKVRTNAELEGCGI